MQPVEPILVGDLFLELHSELLALLHALPAADWDKPTAAAPWTVRDMVAHLLDTDMRLLSFRRDGLPPPDPDKPIGSYAELVAHVDQVNAEWVTAARRISPRLMIDLHALVGPQVHAFLRHLDPYASSRGPVSWAGEELAPNWFDLAREYTEKWHHQMHIREAVGAPGLTSRHFLHPVLNTFVRALPHVYRKVPASEGTQVQLEITGEAGDTWTLLREGSQWHLYLGAGTVLSARVRVDQDIAWHLFTKGISPETARRQAQIDGDESLGEPMLHTVSIIA